MPVLWILSTALLLVAAALFALYMKLENAMAVKAAPMPPPKRRKRTGIEPLLEANRKWVQETVEADPTYFARIANQQSPKFLFIGCSDSRVPAHQILGLPAGGVFVHRNVANLVVNTDMNMLSVLQYAVERLHVEHIIVCGHYNCGGVKAAQEQTELGLIDNWLRNIRDVARLYQDELLQLSAEERNRRLVELNVREQAMNIFKTATVQKARLASKRQTGHSYPRVHALVYDVADGLLQEIDMAHLAQFHKYYGVYGLYALDDSSGGVASMFSPVDEEWSGASDDGSDTERAPATADDDDVPIAGVSTTDTVMLSSAPAPIRRPSGGVLPVRRVSVGPPSHRRRPSAASAAELLLMTPEISFTHVEDDGFDDSIGDIGVQRAATARNTDTKAGGESD